MIERLREFLRNLGWRIHGFALGMSLAWGSMLVGQGCAASGG